VRRALGAQRDSVYRMILRKAGWLIAAAVVVGLVCSLAEGTMMQTLLFGVRAWDVPTLAAVAGRGQGRHSKRSAFMEKFDLRSRSGICL
jgi:hypothetical protein